MAWKIQLLVEQQRNGANSPHQPTTKHVDGIKDLLRHLGVLI